MRARSSSIARLSLLAVIIFGPACGVAQSEMALQFHLTSDWRELALPSDQGKRVQNFRSELKGLSLRYVERECAECFGEEKLRAAMVPDGVGESFARDRVLSTEALRFVYRSYKGLAQLFCVMPLDERKIAIIALSYWPEKPPQGEAQAKREFDSILHRLTRAAVGETTDIER